MWPKVIRGHRIEGGPLRIHGIWHGLHSVYLPNVYVEALVSNVIIFGVGAFERWISALVRREERVCFLSLPCQDTARGLPSVNQQEGPH